MKKKNPKKQKENLMKNGNGAKFMDRILSISDKGKND